MSVKLTNEEYRLINEQRSRIAQALHALVESIELSDDGRASYEIFHHAKRVSQEKLL